MAALAFTFRNCLGEGGYGEVYLAKQYTQGSIQRQVAVKVLHDGFDEASDAVARLRDEGQALALLAHPAILSVHEFVKINARLALVTEYVEGADASYFCDKERLLPTRIVVEVLREIAEALAHAYTVANPMTGKPMRLIHRDVKPANIRLSVDGKVKLLDFGVARSTEMNRRAKTAMGAVLLTAGYGAPEALAFGVTGPTVDVFALAVSVFELLTGEPFYEKQDLKFQVGLAVDSEEYGAHRDRRLALIDPSPLRELLYEMLEFAHEKRPESGQISDLAHEIWKNMEGATMGHWARGYDWPDLSYDDADLCGKSFDTDGNETSTPREDLAPPPPSFVTGSVADIPAKSLGTPAPTPRVEPSAPQAEMVPVKPAGMSGGNKIFLAVATFLAAAIILACVVISAAVIFLMAS